MDHAARHLNSATADFLVLRVEERIRVARHATYYGVARRRLLNHVGLSAPSLEALDHEVSLGQQIVLAGFFHCEPAEVAAMSNVAVREDLRRLIRRSVPLQECRYCARSAELANARGAIGRSWMQGWRVTCRACGGPLIDSVGSQETERKVACSMSIGAPRAQPNHRSQYLGAFLSLGGQNPMNCGTHTDKPGS